MSNNRLTNISLFSGAGGITIGLVKSGFKPLLSVDNDPSVAKTHIKNFSSIPHMEANLADPDVKKKIFDRIKRWIL